ncbi:MAG TPA: hypothetical protein EYN70_01890 [Planctomycetaceae bacterium]|nr:hypothetical protein [Planctomycetaceae bacterium]
MNLVVKPAYQPAKKPGRVEPDGNEQQQVADEECSKKPLTGPGKRNLDLLAVGGFTFRIINE